MPIAQSGPPQCRRCLTHTTRLYMTFTNSIGWREWCRACGEDGAEGPPRAYLGPVDLGQRAGVARP